MKRVYIVFLAIFSCALFSKPALANDFVHISNASQLKWQITDSNKVYLRNLNDFDSTFLACCYNYWIDLATEAGKAYWVTLQIKIAAGVEVDLGVADKTVSGPLNSVGDYY